MRALSCLATSFFFALLATGVGAQTISSKVVGAVTDPSGLAVAGAEVTLINTATGFQRKAQTTAAGDFAFSGILPGTFSLSVASAGFKKAERTDLNLSASETLSVGTIALEVGSLSESVTVRAEGSVVQTASSERSGVLTSSQVDNLMIKGRNVTSLLQLLPGVVDTNNPDAPDRNFGIGLSVNGSRRNANAVTIEGMPTSDGGTGWIAALNISLDAVSEVKVLLNNFQAEYGQMRGANVQMIAKSGTQQFHGSFSYFKRHEQFNANNFFNNRLGQPKPRYRYNTYSYSIGGPVYIPGKFNTKKDKAFFNWSQEIWPQQASTGLQRVTMPTALERDGNFSQTLDVSGRLIPITDSTTGQPFAGNIIPAARLDPNGVALLKFLPLPNFSDRALSGGQYNYLFEGLIDKPQKLNTLKTDYNLTSKDIFSVTWSRHSDTQTGALGLATPSPNWPQFTRTFWTKGNLISGKYVRIVSPTAVNEVVVGHNWRKEAETAPDEELARLSRSTVGFKAGQVFPTANPLGLIPNATFGGVPSAPSLNMNNSIPLAANYRLWNVTDNFTKTLSRHILKAGFMLNRASFTGLQGQQGRGNFNFGVDVNNPLNSNYAFSNAALGVFTSYTESNRLPLANTIGYGVEWFVQDSWKVNKRLTIEAGLRFVQDIRQFSTHTIAYFDPSTWDAAKAVKLIQPTLVNGRRVGINPNTGEVLPAAAIGAIAPGAGDLKNGFVLNSTAGVPRGLVERAGLRYAPRLGFAWDVFGNGKTAVRGGAGAFYSSGNRGEGMAGSETQYPLITTLNFNYGTLAALTTAPGLISPVGTGSRVSPNDVPVSYNLSMGVQQDLGWGTVMEVSYVGTLGRHLMWAFDRDPLPIGARRDPKNADPTNPSVPLPDNFLRRYVGITGVNQRNYGASSNYHSMQTTVNRRFAKGLQVGGSWTWSKYMTTVDFDDNTVNPFVPARVWNYGLANSDRTHNARINFLYDVPKAPWKNLVSRWVLNDWQISGIMSFISGAAGSIGFTTTNNLDITGTPSVGARVNLLANPVLPRGERTFDKWIRTDAVVARPALNTLGNASRAYLRGPGIHSYDLSVFKNLPIREPFKLQLRAEAYNAFNHTQYSGFDSTARFDAQGNQVNALFGQINGARTPRQLQLAIRFVF